MLSLAQHQARLATAQRSSPAVAVAANGTNQAGRGIGSAGPLANGGTATARAPGAHLVALAPTGTERRSLAEVNADAPAFTGAPGSLWVFLGKRVSAAAPYVHTRHDAVPAPVRCLRTLRSNLTLCTKSADPASGLSVRPVASSSAANELPSPSIPDGASVAAANADTLAASQVCKLIFGLCASPWEPCMRSAMGLPHPMA